MFNHWSPHNEISVSAAGKDPLVRNATDKEAGRQAGRTAGTQSHEIIEASLLNSTKNALANKPLCLELLSAIVQLQIYTYTHAHIHAHVHRRTCMHIQLHARKRPRRHAHAYTRIRTRAHIQDNAHEHTHTHTHTHAYKGTHARAHECTHTGTSTHPKQTQASICTCERASPLPFQLLKFI